MAQWGSLGSKVVRRHVGGLKMVDQLSHRESEATGIRDPTETGRNR